MELILTETIDTLGQEGDIVKVKAGYGRNYLLPQGKAVMATEQAIAERDENMAAIQARLEQERGAAEALAKKISGATITIPMRAGDDNRLYGSVTSNDIHEKLSELGIEIDKRKILLEEPIKAMGSTTVAYKAGYQIKAEFTVEVVSIDGGESQDEEQAAEEQPVAEVESESSDE